MKHTIHEHPLLKKARAQAYKKYYLWLSQHKDIREELKIPLLKFKKV